MKIKTPYNQKEFTKNYEKNTLPSMTIPDQAMSIPELIRRYASGLPLGGSRVPFYDENPEEDLLGGKNWFTFDLSEQNDIIKGYRQDYEDTIKRLRNTDKPTQTTNNSEQTVND